MFKTSVSQCCKKLNGEIHRLIPSRKIEYVWCIVKFSNLAKLREYLLRWGNCTNSRPRICGTIILIKCKGIKACNVSKCHLKVCQSDDEQFYRYHKKYFYVHVVPHFLFKLSFKWLMNYCWLETYCLTCKTHLYVRFKWVSLILGSG